MTCSDADAIGGHYWNKDLHAEDPWKDVRYVIQGSMPSAVNDIMVTTGYGAEDINGRAVVVHDYDGARIGCAIIELPVVETPVEGDDLYVFDFSPYPGSSSPYQPQGVVEVKSTEDDNTVLSWSLTGLDPGCSSPCSQTNCCGIHIHEGGVRSSMKDDAVWALMRCWVGFGAGPPQIRALCQAPVARRMPGPTTGTGMARIPGCRSSTTPARTRPTSSPWRSTHTSLAATSWAERW